MIIMFGNLISCQAQTNIKMENQNNPLLCDPVEGSCGFPGNQTSQTTITQDTGKPIKIIYFTDPICSSCWGIEPQLRKLKLEYGSDIEMEYRMGGLLPNWSYNSGGISKPSDVAHHWDEASIYYDMPIDGDVWLEDPLHSSYPPSIAFKAAQLQDKEKAILFLRKIREMLFLQKKNITKWEYLESAAKQVGLNPEKMKTDFDGVAKKQFEEDLEITRSFGVRGFPTLIFINQSGSKEVINGSKPYAFFETAILKLSPNVYKKEYSKNWETLFSKYSSLTAKEFSELSAVPRADSEKQLNDLTRHGNLDQLSTKNGSMWFLKKEKH